MTSSNHNSFSIYGNNAIKLEDGSPRRFDLEPAVPQPSGSNWIHHALIAVHMDGLGLGVIATQDIEKDTVLIVYGGKIITTAEFEALSEDMQHYPYQVSNDLFLSPADLSDIGLAERVNHSCEPNSGFKGPIHLVAIRDIETGEQITFDYATCVAANDNAFVMKCYCGSSRCRKTITGQDWQLKEVQSRLFPYFQPFLQEKIQLRRKSFKTLL